MTEMKKKHPGGRPTKYKPEYCQQLIDFMSDGFSLEAFAGKVSVTKDTVYQWRDKYPEFSDSIKVGFAKCRVFWEDMGKKGLFTDKEEKFNATVWIFNMKNRFGWRDQQSVELSGPGGGPVQTMSIKPELLALTDEELKELLKSDKI